jgi:hypothetical protein
MPKAQSILYPASFVVLFLVCATFLWPLGGGRVSAVEMPDLRSAPEPYVAVSNTYVAPDPPTSASAASTAPKAYPTTRSCRPKGASATVPAGSPGRGHQGDHRAGPHAHRARHKGALRQPRLRLRKFIDSEDFLDYKGGALIFNTAAGAYFQGFAYGPPNNKGYLVRAAE